jgi:hypothetical protein
MTQYVQAKVEKVGVHKEVHIDGDNIDEDNVLTIMKYVFETWPTTSEMNS